MGIEHADGGWKDEADDTGGVNGIRVARAADEEGGFSGEDGCADAVVGVVRLG